MDARQGDESRSYRASTKRPWEDETSSLSPQNDTRLDMTKGAVPGSSGRNATQMSFLPPIDLVSYNRPSIPRGIEPRLATSGYGQGFGEPEVKKSKLANSESRTFSRQGLNSNTRFPPPPPPPPPYIHRPVNAGYGESRSLTEPPIIRIPPRLAGPAVSPSDSTICRQCKKLTTQDQELDEYGVPDACNLCRHNPELDWVTQATYVGLTQLSETLRSGVSSEQRGITPVPNQASSNTADCPPIVQFGLKHTLIWILGKINQVNSLADDFVRQIPPSVLSDIRLGNPNDRTAHNGPTTMKRPYDANAEDTARTWNETIQANLVNSHARRKSMTGDELPPMRTQIDYHPPDRRVAREDISLLTQPLRRSSMISPAPPTPTRQLPSPPERLFPSPTSFNLPSPSGPAPFGTASQASNRLPPPLAHQPASNQYLPPITSTNSPTSALRDHSATLQHEVSIQKLKLSSLQGEHDKLLAAFQRSQTRASALEKKHAVSDAEINSLTEDKQRLQQQISDLERDVEELSKSKEESRQTAVQEGSQYVKIVERATKLEEIALKEKRTWEKLKEEMERRIDALIADRSRREALITTQPAEELVTVRVVARDEASERPAAALTDNPLELKTEVTVEPHPPDPSPIPQNSIDDLKEEIHRLRAHCAEMAEALQNIRDMGRSMMERADAALNG